MKTSQPRKKKPEEINRTPLKELDMATEDWEGLEQGINLFNQRQFWHAHEAWEQVWQRHNEDERLFFQGLIQLAAAFHNLTTKRSFQGMMNNFDKAYAKLEVFRPDYLGISVQPLLQSIDLVKKEAEQLDGQLIDQNNLELLPVIQFRKQVNPDTLIEIRSVISSANFLEGAGLFNKGYYWEAHETWEDLWREEYDDGKIFAEAFVQMASGYSFIKLSKFANVAYCFTKAIEKFHKFKHHDSGLSLIPLIACMEMGLRDIESHSHNGKVPFKLSKIPSIELPAIK